MTIRRQWQALLERLPDLPKETGPVVQEHPAASDLRETARATRTEPREDPSPAEATLSANAKAYEDDLRNFR